MKPPVVGVKVRNCTISGTTNGVRIKTWPASYTGSLSDMHFEDIIMNNVTNPVLVDQMYCPWNQCNTKVIIPRKHDRSETVLFGDYKFEFYRLATIFPERDFPFSASVTG